VSFPGGARIEARLKPHRLPPRGSQPSLEQQRGLTPPLRRMGLDKSASSTVRVLLTKQKLISDVLCSSPLVATALLLLPQQVLEEVARVFSIHASSMTIATTAPDDFLLFMPDCATADAVLNRGSPLHGPMFSLFFNRWTRIVQGSAVALTKWFCDTSTRAAQEQPVVVLLRGRLLASWVLALGERNGHGDLRGSDRLSVIPYVHGRTELYCAQVCLA
jgi:hypothetical protein